MGIQRWRGAAVATGVAGMLVGTVGVHTAVAGPETVPVADLRADVNRDGRVDVDGRTDTAGEGTWTALRGAVVLPNVDDDSERCPTTTPSGGALGDGALARCHDAADTVVNGAADAADLARLKTVPNPEYARGTTGSVEVVRDGGRGPERARLFLQRDGRWQHLTPSSRLTTQELRNGVEIGAEATDVIRDAAVWDGTVRVRLTVTKGGKQTTDEVVLRTAPVLTHHHNQRTQRMLVAKTTVDFPEMPYYRPAQNAFVKNLKRTVKPLGQPVTTVKTTWDGWTQDFVEPGYVSMTGPGGKTHAMRVLIRSAQPDRVDGRTLYTQLRGKDVGVVSQFAGPTFHKPEWSLNSMGNLETIPPYSHRGEQYPAGRIIMGHWPGEKLKPAPSMTTFLASQGAQKPLLLDTGWLTVGHVDEFVQFLPAKTPRGWRIGLADPRAGLELLRTAQAGGHGGTKVFSAPSDPRHPVPDDTIAQKLADKKFVADNEMAAERIEANLRILKKATGVTDAEVVRVPTLFTRHDLGRPGAQGGPVTLRQLSSELAGVPGLTGAGATARARTAAGVTTGAYIPGAVNGVVLDDKQYLSAKQWGPVIGGKDIFGTAVSAAYAKAGFRTTYIDDWYSHHVAGGEVHCGTNTLRDTSAKWWRKP
ncbi:protein-arginine deiminase domain-containing protein [Streptomyces sp. NPDC057638]|uniref:protein-arginine deiminase domain-containing protein n=1 Tax=Streptomyces sp. NPDC057638 TaxID=3346190 RepID=UPI00367FDFAB